MTRARVSESRTTLLADTPGTPDTVNWPSDRVGAHVPVNRSTVSAAPSRFASVSGDGSVPEMSASVGSVVVVTSFEAGPSAAKSLVAYTHTWKWVSPSWPVTVAVVVAPPSTVSRFGAPWKSLSVCHATV